MNEYIGDFEIGEASLSDLACNIKAKMLLHMMGGIVATLKHTSVKGRSGYVTPEEVMGIMQGVIVELLSVNNLIVRALTPGQSSLHAMSNENMLLLQTLEEKQNDTQLDLMDGKIDIFKVFGYVAGLSAVCREELKGWKGLDGEE